MKLGFEEAQVPYESPSQSARAWTEQWVKQWVYCPNCGQQHIDPFPRNQPVADFFCAACKEEYELKSQKSRRKGFDWSIPFHVRAPNLVQQPEPHASELRS